MPTNAQIAQWCSLFHKHLSYHGFKKSAWKSAEQVAAEHHGKPFITPPANAR